MLIICDIVENETCRLKPKKPIILVGLDVSDDIREFTVHETLYLKKLTELSENASNLLNAENAFSINVPSIQKMFKFYAG
jgi:hypothetical protein